MARFVFPLAAAVLFLGAATGFAQDAETVDPPVHDAGARFADADGDGINDTAPGEGRGPGAHGQFLDEDGDGINDLAPDHDGDGVPNGEDVDYVRGARGGEQGQGQGKGRLSAGDGLAGIEGCTGEDGAVAPVAARSVAAPRTPRGRGRR